MTQCCGYCQLDDERHLCLGCGRCFVTECEKCVNKYISVEK